MSAPLQNGNSVPKYLPTWPPHAIELAQTAYELTNEEWALTGQGEFHPTIASLKGNGGGEGYKNIVEEIAHRMVALLVVRLVALLTSRLGNRYEDDLIETTGGSGGSEQKKIYSDYSTSTICQTVLCHADHHNQDWESYNPSDDGSSFGPKRASSNMAPPFPAVLTRTIINQLHAYTLAICDGYHSAREVPYHNVEHAYHVFLSANKLLDLMLFERKEGNGSNGQRYRTRRPTFGIKSDPLTQFAFLFSALVHDVDHTGISNRQLVLESDDLAVLYNDQSVAEQRSLAVAFTTLRQPMYAELRDVIFKAANCVEYVAPGRAPASVPVNSDGDDFFRFRKLVIDLVLSTDIASPERTQIVKSKWKEAFGDVQISEKMKKDSDKEKNDEKNVNFERSVNFKPAAINNKGGLSSSLISAASALSLDPADFSDSASSAMSASDFFDDDEFNQSIASCTKMNIEEFLGSSNSIKSSDTSKSKEDVGDKKTSDGRRRRVRPRHLSASTTSVPANRKLASRFGGLSRSVSTGYVGNRPSDNRRLGVRRALDLAGSTIEAVSTFKRVNSDADLMSDELEDDVDEFKATVVLEQMLRAADVGALLQDFENVRKWSTRLYRELNNGFCAGRGEDPKVGWFDNQIKFFDFYILPLAKNLGVTGVFGDEIGQLFVQCVKCNRSQWIDEGESRIDLMIQLVEKERAQMIENGPEPMPSQGRAFSVSASDVTVHTGNPGQPENMGGSVTSRKLTRTRSLETGEGRECIVCGVAARFNCPRCSSPYCSAQCCREHKTSCQ